MKNKNKLRLKGKQRRLNKAHTIMIADCLTDDFLRAYREKDYDKIRQILRQDNRLKQRKNKSHHKN